MTYRFLDYNNFYPQNRQKNWIIWINLKPMRTFQIWNQHHGEKCLGQIDYVACVSQNYNDSWVFLTQGWRSSLRQTKVWYSGKVLLCVTKDCSNCRSAGCLRPIDAAGALLVSWTQREWVSASFSTLALRGTMPLPMNIKATFDAGSRVRKTQVTDTPWLFYATNFDSF